MNLGEILADSARHHPDRVAIVWHDGKERRTYWEVDDRAEALAAALTRRAFRCTTVGSRVEVVAPDVDAALDAVRDEVADLGLALNRLSTRLTSLDEVFLERARS